MEFCLFANQSENLKHNIIQFNQNNVGSDRVVNELGEIDRVGWGFIRRELTSHLIEAKLIDFKYFDYSKT